MDPNGKPSLADVDGREPGKVQLMSIKLVEDLDEDPEQMHTYFEEEDGKPDPWTSALGLKHSIEGDWPGHHWAIVGNWRARYLRWKRQMTSMGIDLSESDVSPKEYLETFK